LKANMADKAANSCFVLNKVCNCYQMFQVCRYLLLKRSMFKLSYFYRTWVLQISSFTGAIDVCIKGPSTDCVIWTVISQLLDETVYAMLWSLIYMYGITLLSNYIYIYIHFIATHCTTDVCNHTAQCFVHLFSVVV
jgi:hypothetical protein